MGHKTEEKIIKRKAEVTSSPSDHPQKKQKLSAENSGRFQRINTDATNFKNDRLADNSFAGKGETWGNKAAQDLGKVKGDRFRREKTKKKRGTYKGTGIDFKVKSVPLDSEDESK